MQEEIRPFAHKEPLPINPETGNEMFRKIEKTFFNCNNDSQNQTHSREKLNIFDLGPTPELIDKDFLYAVIFNFVIQNPKHFPTLQQSSIRNIKMKMKRTDSSEISHIDNLKLNAKKFFENPRNKNIVFGTWISDIWDITGTISTLTFLKDQKKRIGPKPNNFDEFIEFVLSASANKEAREEKKITGATQLVRCTFSKMILAITLASRDEVIKKADEEMLHSINNIRNIDGFTIISEQPGSIKFRYQGVNISYTGEVKYRLKAIFKIILKILSNREYANIDEIKDLGGIRIILDPPEEIEINEAIRMNAIKIFGNAIFPDGENIKFRIKGNFVNEKKVKEDLGYHTRGQNKGSTAEIANVSLVSKLQEIQIEELGNMDNLWKSPEFNDLKKFLHIAGRDFHLLTISNILIALNVILPKIKNNQLKMTSINPIPVLHYLIDGKILNVYTQSEDNTIIFRPCDTESSEYKKLYNEPEIIKIQEFDETFWTHLDKEIKKTQASEKYKKALKNILREIGIAENIFKNFDLNSILR